MASGICRKLVDAEQFGKIPEILGIDISQETPPGRAHPDGRSSASSSQRYLARFYAVSVARRTDQKGK
jgi:hypothetical protein